MSGVLLEARSYRPFKSSEEYLFAMKEDLAEWLNQLYPELGISVDTFMEKLETGVSLCKHANSVRKSAEEYVARKQLRRMTSSAAMTASIMTKRALPITQMKEIQYKLSAKPGTFFARDNVCHFIDFCRKGLEILECLLFETDDLILRKNEKNVILCLLEVARRGAKFGMLAPILVQMEREIDREIAAEQRLARGDEADDEQDDDDDDDVEYGPVPQIITNDLKSLDEMVRDLVEKCTCPTQFPMIRVSEGKYRIGDTKVLIFVRILRSHVMVRVGGGWDTLSHYLDKHDPCRCRNAHRTALSSKLVMKNSGPIELNHAQVYYDRSPPRTRRSSASSTSSGHGKDYLNTSPQHRPQRSRSPTPRREIKQNTKYISTYHFNPPQRTRSPSPGLQVPGVNRRSPSPNRRSRSPDVNVVKIRDRSRSPGLKPNRLHEASTAASRNRSRSPSVRRPEDDTEQKPVTTEDKLLDSGSEVSDEGYRSLGLIVNGGEKNRLSGHSSVDEVDCQERPSSECSSTVSTNDGELQHICNDDDKSTIKDNSVSGSCNELNKTKSSRSSSLTSSPIRKTSKEYLTSQTEQKQPSQSLQSSPIRKKNRSISQNSSPIRRISDDKGKNVRSVSQHSSPIKHPNVPRISRKDISEQNSQRSRSACSGEEEIIAIKKITKKVANSMGKLNTWNGKIKARPGIQGDTFVRNSAKTGSFGAGSSNHSPTKSSVTYDPITGRRIQKSPNKTPVSPLVEEILKSKNLSDDRLVLQKMKQLIDQYSDILDETRYNDDDFTTNWVRNNGAINIKDEAVPTKRKDGKFDGNASKIPAPVFFKQPISEKEC